MVGVEENLRNVIFEKDKMLKKCKQINDELKKELTLKKKFLFHMKHFDLTQSMRIESKESSLIASVQMNFFFKIFSLIKKKVYWCLFLEVVSTNTPGIKISTLFILFCF